MRNTIVYYVHCSFNQNVYDYYLTYIFEKFHILFWISDRVSIFHLMIPRFLNNISVERRSYDFVLRETLENLSGKRRVKSLAEYNTNMHVTFS